MQSNTPGGANVSGISLNVTKTEIKNQITTPGQIGMLNESMKINNIEFQSKKK